MSVPLYWWKINSNFGDLLSPMIVSHYSGHPVHYAEQPPKLLAVGSVLHFATPGDIVWGSGLRHECTLPQNLAVHAVRGPMTREFLLKSGIDCPEVYGDPAILMPDIYFPDKRKTVPVTVLPHYSDRILQWMAQCSGLPVIMPSDPPHLVIDRILQTELLVTSSLHGLIVAEAYGVPVVLLRQKRQYWEPHFKFVDYFHSTDREDQTLWDATITAAVKQVGRIEKPKPIDKSALLAAFPEQFRNREVER